MKEVIRKSDRKQYAAKCFKRKFTRNEIDWEDVEREINIMRSIQHRNIVAYRKVIKMNNQLIIIMQWYEILIIGRINYHSENVLSVIEID